MNGHPYSSCQLKRLYVTLERPYVLFTSAVHFMVQICYFPALCTNFYPLLLAPPLISLCDSSFVCTSKHSSTFPPFFFFFFCSFSNSHPSFRLTSPFHPILFYSFCSKQPFIIRSVSLVHCQEGLVRLAYRCYIDCPI
jgi:hypothetical protein